jgi:hypothetical protein
MIAEQKAGGNKPKAQPKQVGLLTVLQVSDLHWVRAI